jgi:hypothetical protein
LFRLPNGFQDFFLLPVLLLGVGRGVLGTPEFGERIERRGVGIGNTGDLANATGLSAHKPAVKSRSENQRIAKRMRPFQSGPYGVIGKLYGLNRAK